MNAFHWRISVLGVCGCLFVVAVGIWILGFPHRKSPVIHNTAKLDPFPPPKHVLIPKLRANIKVDGELNEPVWSSAAALGPFYNNDPLMPEREHTEVRVWYDDEALYLGWICHDADLQATYTKRDSPLWEQDVVEFYVTSQDLSHYFEFEWNPLNAVFDAVITNRLDQRGISMSFNTDKNYTATNLQSVAKISDGHDQYWCVEVRLAFADLGCGAPKPHDVWRGNFYRYNYALGYPKEQLSWSPVVLPGFHQPNRFGFIEFGE